MTPNLTPLSIREEGVKVYNYHDRNPIYGVIQSGTQVSLH